MLVHSRMEGGSKAPDFQICPLLCSADTRGSRSQANHFPPLSSHLLTSELVMLIATPSCQRGMKAWSEQRSDGHTKDGPEPGTQVTCLSNQLLLPDSGPLLMRGGGSLAGQTHRPAAEATTHWPRSQGEDAASLLLLFPAAGRNPGPPGCGVGRAQVPCRDRLPRRTRCCLAHHSARSAGLETQSWCWRGRWEQDGHNLDRMGGCGVLPKGQGEFVLDQGLGPGGGRPRKVLQMACAILTGGPALPIGLDGVALVAGGTAERDRRWSEALPGAPPTMACFSRPLRALTHLSQRRPV